MQLKGVWIAGGLIILAGCGGAEPAQESDKTVPPASAAAGWNAANACALVDRKIVAEAAGSGVTDARLGSSNPGGDGLAATSTCTFVLSDNSSVSILTRRSPTPDFSAAAVEQARTMGGNMPAAEDVPKLGRAALWTRETNSLQVFIDDSRYLTITVVNPLSGKPPKDVATAIAAKLI